MTATISKESLYCIQTRQGGDLIHGTFKIVFSGTYATGGEAIDLRPYVKKIVSCEVQPIYNATNTAIGYMFVVDDRYYARGSATPGLVYVLLLNPTVAHSHTCYAHDHDLSFLAAGGAGVAVTWLVASAQLERAGGTGTDTATVQNTTVAMADNTATYGTEVVNGTAYRTNVAVRLVVNGE